MQIFVAAPNHTIVLDVKPSDSVDSIKEQIARREGLEIADQRLIFSGKQLEEGTLGDHNVQPFATIQVVLRLLGGVTNLYNYFAMRIPPKVWRDQRVRETVAREEIRRKAIKAISVNQRLDIRIRMAASMKLSQMTRDGSYVRVHDYCTVSGKSRSIVRPFGVCRNVFRQLALYNMIPGVRKSSW